MARKKWTCEACGKSYVIREDREILVCPACQMPVTMPQESDLESFQFQEFQPDPPPTSRNNSLLIDGIEEKSIERTSTSKLSSKYIACTATKWLIRCYFVYAFAELASLIDWAQQGNPVRTREVAFVVVRFLGIPLSLAIAELLGGFAHFLQKNDCRHG